jgi:hypothetical protein
MKFFSILFESIDEHTKKEAPTKPDFFVDLNLDQIM